MKQRFSFALLNALLLAGGCASADEDLTWGHALDAEIRDEWRAPEYRAFDFWIGEWEMNWRQKPQDEFYHVKEGSWTRQRVFPILNNKTLIKLT